MKTGSCLCGSVAFEIHGPMDDILLCHCTQCRKQTGHYEVSTDVPRRALSIAGEEHLTWYFSSEAVRRGFCAICGSSLFWDPVRRDLIGVSMGAFDGPTRTRLGIHVHVAEKGDYYEIADGLPQNQH